MAEPAVVEHEELEPEIRRARSERVHLLVVEVEIRRLPVVDEDGAHRVAVFAAQEMLAIRRMERLRHPVQPIRRVDADDFRRLERLSRRELPGEIRRVQPRDDTRRAELLHLRLHREAAAVNQAERIDLPGQLSRLGAREREERRLLVRARAARARRLLDTAQEAAALEAAFRRMAAVEAQPVERMVGEVDAEARRLLEAQRRLPRVLDPHGARQDAVARKDRVREHHLETPARIAQRDLERLRLVLLRVERREALKARLAAQDAVPIVEEVDDVRPVREHNAERRDAEIPVPLLGELLRQHIERERAVVLIVLRLRRKRAVESRELRAAAKGAQGPPPVAMQEVPAARHLKDVAEPIVSQVEYLRLLIE